MGLTACTLSLAGDTEEDLLHSSNRQMEEEEEDAAQGQQTSLKPLVTRQTGWP